jgi:HEAT repeat protein
MKPVVALSLGLLLVLVENPVTAGCGHPYGRSDLALPEGVSNHRKDLVPALTQFLGDEDEVVRLNALHALLSLGLDKGLVPTLLRALNDSNAEVRETAQDALTRLGREAVPGLVEELSNPDKARRTKAALMLGKMGAVAHEALPALVSALQRKGEDQEVRRAASAALRQIVAPNPTTTLSGN